MAPDRTEQRTADPAGCQRPAPARLCPAAVPGDGRILELRHLLLHHFDPDGRRPAVRLRSQVRRAHHQHRRLATDQRADALRRGVDGGAGVGVPDGGRALLLGLSAGRPGLGVDHRMAQHDRPDHHHRRHQRRRLDLHHRGHHPHLQRAGGRHGPRLRLHHQLVLPDLRDGADHDSPGADQHPGHPAHRQTQRFQRLLAHRRRRRDRGAADLSGPAPQQPELHVLRAPPA